MVRLGLITCLVVASFPIKAANAQTFGLGVSSEVSHVTVSTFGLGSAVVITPTVKQEVAKPDTPPPVAQSRTVVVRVARSSWADSSVGSWTVETLRAHLRGELASGQHRGRVPMDELEGRTLKELKDIHDNLHEGFAWNGAVQRTVTVQKYQTNCPGGVCPTYQPVRRLFRR